MGIRHPGGLNEHHIRPHGLGDLMQCLDEIRLHTGTEDRTLADLQNVSILTFNHGHIHNHLTRANQPHPKAQAPVYILHLINSLADTGIRVAGPVPPAARTGCSWLPPKWGARTPRPAELYREDHPSSLLAGETSALLLLPPVSPLPGWIPSFCLPGPSSSPGIHPSPAPGRPSSWVCAQPDSLYPPDELPSPSCPPLPAGGP